jgi:hypothetical protein
MGDPMPAPRQSTPTVLAIAMVAYLLAKVAHEAVGHGLACLAVGADLRGFSTSWCDCDKAEVGAWATRTVKASGTLANIVLGVAVLGALRRRRDADATAYALWLVAAVNLFMAAGYLLVDPILGFGDWTAFVEGLSHPFLWRALLIASGVVLAMVTAVELLPYLGTGGRDRVERGLQLALVPWAVVGGGVMTAVAALNVMGVKYAVTSAMATVGGTSFLSWFYQIERSFRIGTPIDVMPSRPWMVAGFMALVGAVVLGRGLVFG